MVYYIVLNVDIIYADVNNDRDFKFYFKEYVFIDDTPFGIKE